MQTLAEVMTTRAVHCYKGRTALRLILEALGVGPGDEVIVPGFTCMAVPLPVVSLGATPVYADIREEDYNLDPLKVEAAVTPRTRAIVAQHTFGIPADLDRLVEIARRHGLHLIEDCCHTLTSRYKGRVVGTFGEAAFYSYEWGKPIILGGGGSAVGNTDTLKTALRRLFEECEYLSTVDSIRLRIERVLHSAIVRPALFWRVRALFRYFGHLGLTDQTFTASELNGMMRHQHRRMAGWMRRLLEQKVERLAEDSEFRARIARQYEAGLVGLGLPVRPQRPELEVTHLRYPLLVADKQRVLDKARERRIEMGDWYSSPVHPLGESEWGRVGYRRGACPVAESVARRIVTLPIYRRVTDASIQRALTLLGELKHEGAL
jgi:dTDP-4-amino-4,6-dideoxygalactose transaminase